MHRMRLPRWRRRAGKSRARPTMQYGSPVIMRDLDFTVARGEVFVLMAQRERKEHAPQASHRPQGAREGTILVRGR